MDEAERCHRLAYLAYGNLLTRGSVPEVIEQAGLTTWAVAGDAALAAELKALPEVEQVVAFGNMLHVSGTDATKLKKALKPFKKGRGWRQVAVGLEDVFIHLMGQAEDNF